MDMPNEDPKSWFGVVSAGLFAILAWVMKRHVSKQDEHDERLRLLEIDRVTKDDINSVHERIGDVSAQLARQHEMTLKALTAMRKL